MKKIFFLVLVLAVTGLSLISCYMKTEHKIEALITLDIREVKEAANGIEDMVSSKKDKDDQSFLILPWKVGVVYGQGIKYMTPAVETAVANRKTRFNSLQELMVKGCIGENNRGYVEYRPCPACESDSQLLGKVGKLIQEENRDRQTIYKAIVEQNNLDANNLAVLEKGYGEVRQERAPSGTFIQKDDGSWVQK